VKRYKIEISLNAQKGIKDYVDFIRNEYKSPLTAERHLLGLYTEIDSLSIFAESIQVSTRQRVLIHGPNARSVKYKKMCIIYTVHNDKVIVHELLPCSMIISGQ
jgi:hypothetical protein